MSIILNKYYSFMIIDFLHPLEEIQFNCLQILTESKLILSLISFNYVRNHNN